MARCKAYRNVFTFEKYVFIYVHMYMRMCGLGKLEKKTIELEFQVIPNHSAWILVSKLGSIQAVCALSH